MDLTIVAILLSLLLSYPPTAFPVKPPTGVTGIPVNDGGAPAAGPATREVSGASGNRDDRWGRT